LYSAHSVSHSTFALTDDLDRAYFGRGGEDGGVVEVLEAEHGAWFGT
jgi:hypothetical protein